MSEPIVIEMAGPPVAFARTRPNQRGILFEPAPQRNYKAALRILAAEAMKGRPPIDGPVELTVCALFPVPASWSKRKQARAVADLILPAKRPDWDNIGKLAADALNAIVYRDDALIVTARVSKRYDERPRLLIRVEQK